MNYSVPLNGIPNLADARDICNSFVTTLGKPETEVNRTAGLRLGTTSIFRDKPVHVRMCPMPGAGNVIWRFSSPLIK
jgi:hypothetical protein